MNRIMILATAFMVVVAGLAVAPVEAEAGLFDRNKCCKPQKCRKARRAQNCCQPAQSCAPVETCCAPVEPVCAAPAPAPCGCEAAPSCESEIDCNCLSRRKLRRANRKGQCCGAVAKSCNTCSAPVSTCGYETAAPVSGCSSCSSCSGGTIIESAPTPAAGEEAAPEAPEPTT